MEVQQPVAAGTEQEGDVFLADELQERVSMVEQGMVSISTELSDLKGIISQLVAVVQDSSAKLGMLEERLVLQQLAREMTETPGQGLGRRDSSADYATPGPPPIRATIEGALRPLPKSKVLETPPVRFVSSIDPRQLAKEYHMTGNVITLKSALWFTRKVKESLDTEGNLPFLIFNALTDSQRRTFESDRLICRWYPKVAAHMWAQIRPQELLDILHDFVIPKTRLAFQGMLTGCLSFPYAKELRIFTLYEMRDKVYDLFQSYREAFEEYYAYCLRSPNWSNEEFQYPLTYHEVLGAFSYVRFEVRGEGLEELAAREA